MYHYPNPHGNPMYPMGGPVSPNSPMPSMGPPPYSPNSMLNGNLNYDHGMSNVNFPNTHPS